MEIVILLGIPLLVLLISFLIYKGTETNYSHYQNYRNSSKQTYKSSDSQSVKEYKQILDNSQKVWKDKNAVYTGKEQKGKNGGRYRLRETKNGKKYRQYY